MGEGFDGFFFVREEGGIRVVVRALGLGGGCESGFFFVFAVFAGGGMVDILGHSRPTCFDLFLFLGDWREGLGQLWGTMNLSLIHS